MTDSTDRCHGEHNSRCARCSKPVVCPACSSARLDNRGRWPGYCDTCAAPLRATPAVVPPAAELAAIPPSTPHTPLVNDAPRPRLLVARPINTREILTTERSNIGRDDALLRYLRTTRAREPIRPVAVTPSFWIQDALAAEVSRRDPGVAMRRRMDEARQHLGRSQFCLLDGDHRALAAALLDRPVSAVVIETPAQLDDLRRSDPAFPHDDVDLLRLGRKWLDFAYGSVEQAAFDHDPLTVSERAELIERAGLLPSGAAELLARARRDRDTGPERVETCTCPPAPGSPGGVSTWGEHARRRASCPRHRSRG